MKLWSSVAGCRRKKSAGRAGFPNEAAEKEFGKAGPDAADCWNARPSARLALWRDFALQTRLEGEASVKRLPRFMRDYPRQRGGWKRGARAVTTTVTHEKKFSLYVRRRILLRPGPATFWASRFASTLTVFSVILFLIFSRGAVALSRHGLSGPRRRFFEKCFSAETPKFAPWLRVCKVSPPLTRRAPRRGCLLSWRTNLASLFRAR